MSEKRRELWRKKLKLKKIRISEDGKKKITYVPLKVMQKPVEKCLFEPDTNLLVQEQIEPQKGTTNESNLIQSIEKWAKIRPELLKVHIECMCPATNECGLCGNSCDKIMFCPECGPTSYYNAV